MNETRNIMIGFDFGEKDSQISYYDRQEKEPISISPKMGSNQYEFPTLLSKKPGEMLWHIGLEAEYFVKQQGEILVESFYRCCNGTDYVFVDGEMVSPHDLLAQYLKEVLKLLGISDPVRQISSIMTTTAQLSVPMVRNLQKAYEILGFDKKRCFMQDHDESFYYYVLSQRTDYWNRRVAWFTFTKDHVTYARLIVDTKTRPMMVKISRGKTVNLPEEAEEKDQELYQLILESFGTEQYSSIFLVGEGFDKEWAKRSVPLLCKNKRHVFFGNNLFVKGACYAAREKVEDKLLKGYLYDGSSLVKVNIGMEMLVQGMNAYYPIIEAGCNWYESAKEFEIILDEKEDLSFLVSRMDDKTRSCYSMPLPELPKRPNRTTRLRVHMEYESSFACVITVEDLGFGELYPASRRIWTEKVSW